MSPDTSALTSLISEAENLVDRIERKTINDAALAARAGAAAKKQLERIYATEWLTKANFRTLEEARADMIAAISVLRALDVEVGGGWRGLVGGLWRMVQLKFGWN